VFRQTTIIRKLHEDQTNQQPIFNGVPLSTSNSQNKTKKTFKINKKKNLKSKKTVASGHTTKK